MNPLERFQQYAAAFEEFVATGSRAELVPFFTEDAVYQVVAGEPFGGRHAGRDAVIDHLAASLDGFDRRFESRQLELLDGPALMGGDVWLRWRASYKSAGLPELVIDGEERVHFEGDRIALLEDIFPPQISSLIRHWFDHYAPSLPPPP